MSSVFPQTTIEQIQFCESHIPIWLAAPASVGLTLPQVQALDTATKACREQYTKAQGARLASKAATTTLNTGAIAMRTQAADLIRQIKAYAELQPSPGTVYGAAQIPEPLPPTPMPAPGVPTDIRVSLEPSGAVTISWTAIDAAASAGAFYTVSRKLPGQTAFSPVGGAPGTTRASRTMSFTDYSVPTSAAGSGAQYIIQGQRAEVMGRPSDAITVQFGVDGGGGFSVMGAGAQALKMAA